MVATTAAQGSEISLDFSDKVPSGGVKESFQASSWFHTNVNRLQYYADCVDQTCKSDIVF